MNTALREQMAACQQCDLACGGTQPVQPDWAQDFIGLMAMGEAPGAKEAELGQGFVGAAGKTLDQLLDSRGVQRAAYGRCNVAACRPPNNRKPKKDEIAACESWVRQFLAVSHTTVVLAVGWTPTARFYGAKSLTEALERASDRNFVPDAAWAQELGIKVVPMPHTSPLCFNRNAPDGRKWKLIGEEQVGIAVSLASAKQDAA